MKLMVLSHRVMTCDDSIIASNGQYNRNLAATCNFRHTAGVAQFKELEGNLIYQFIA